MNEVGEEMEEVEEAEEMEDLDEGVAGWSWSKEYADFRRLLQRHSQKIAIQLAIDRCRRELMGCMWLGNRPFRFSAEARRIACRYA